MDDKKEKELEAAFELEAAILKRKHYTKLHQEDGSLCSCYEEGFQTGINIAMKYFKKVVIAT